MWKRIFKWIIFSAIALIIFLAIAGFTYNFVEQRADARGFPQQGRSVALGPGFGNLTLNIDCSGQGTPTVVLDAGLGVPGAAGWKQVQPKVAQFTRVCSYDRAGLGWSGAGPMPRTSNQLARELHALLIAAGEKPPYILVGHSLGGFNVRVFSGLYPDDVTGMVLVDPSQEDQEIKMSPALRKLFDQQAGLFKWQARFAPALVYLGIGRLLDDTASLTFLSPADRREALYLELQPRAYAATWSEWESFPESTNQVRASGNLGNKPLIVLSAGQIGGAPPGLQKDLDDFLNAVVHDLHPRLVRLSTNGRQIIVPDSDHMIPFERPEAVVSAVHEVWSLAAKSFVAGALLRKAKGQSF